MTLRRVAPVAIIAMLGLAGQTAAQTSQQAPAQIPQRAPPPMMQPAPMQSVLQAPMSMQQGAPQGAPPCMAEFAPLRAEAEKRAAAIKAGAQRKALPPELCQLFSHFSDAEEKVIKFMESHAAACGIPPQVLSGTKANHAKTAETRQRVCTVAAEPTRRAPGLGEALGMRAPPTADSTTGKGTYDTLSGNALAK